jgi:ABC-2 type transport system ATP-binding protein
MIKNYADTEGVSILLSSHNMLEVEYMCHKVALINQGLVVAEGTPRNLIEEYGKQNLEEVFMEVTQSE